MCVRYALTAPPAEVAAALGYAEAAAFPPRYGIVPAQPIAVVRGERGGRRLVLMRWGLIPAWVKDPDTFQLIANGRAETAAARPAFANALRYRRCLVPASGYYEARRSGGRRRVHWVAPAAGGVLAFGGLWECWAGADGSEIDTACILTVAAAGDIAGIGARTPLVLAPADFDLWLAPGDLTAGEAARLIAPAPPGFFAPLEVEDAASGDGPELQRPAVGDAQLRLF
jgi:putative SOS response-associated peptidase YedK